MQFRLAHEFKYKQSFPKFAILGRTSLDLCRKHFVLRNITKNNALMLAN